MSTAQYREVVAYNNGRHLTLADLTDLVAQSAVAGAPEKTVVRFKPSLLSDSGLSKIILRWQEGQADEPVEEGHDE